MPHQITFQTQSGESLTAQFVGILSSPILINDGNYEATTIHGLPEIKGIRHYIGHPTTASIIEAEGAILVPSPNDPSKPGSFEGLQPGEAMLAVPIQQQKLDRSTGYTTDQSVTLDDLAVRIIYRRA